MTGLRWCASALIAANALLFSAAGSDAQTRPAAQRQLSRGQVSPPLREPKLERAQHNIFGTMGHIGPRRFLLRTRSGRIMLVDDTLAIARGTYSAPLFPGKIVLVSGSFDRSLLFHATAITRYNSLDSTTPRDN